MRKVFLLLSVFALSASIFSCRKKGEIPPEIKMEAEMLTDTTTIEFVDSVDFFFDTITAGDKVQHTFHIKNTGDKNLIIARAFGSCGCTVPEYPKDPVKPGETAAIHVTFNSEGKLNEQKKQVTIVCNTEKRNEVVLLTGFVKEKN
ncbi:MAG: DUF1573 domain-containing protein [Bacteroidetes bacterium]|nr:DUF1573 domain-containing protein [Bacteroidota bacterium]